MRMRQGGNAHMRATTERAEGERTLLVHQTNPWTLLSSNVTLVLVSPGRFIKAPSIMSR